MLVVRTLYASECQQMLSFLDAAFRAAPFSCAMDEQEVESQCFQPAPDGVHEVQWLGHQVFGVVEEEALLGFIDVGVGFDRATLHLSGGRPLGLLRFLALPDDALLAARVAHLLMEAAEEYWRQEGIRRVHAYSLSTGYPAFQSGAGILPATWDDQLSWLMGAGFRLAERFYCFRHPLQRSLAEILPRGGYTLWPRVTAGEHHYQIFADDEQVARGCFRVRHVLDPDAPNPIAYLCDWEVAREWRRRGLGRWLLRRAMNDAFLLGCRQMVLHLNHAAQAAFVLLLQHGYEEINYRGYSLERRL